jgi:hypothetical protein
MPHTMANVSACAAACALLLVSCSSGIGRCVGGACVMPPRPAEGLTGQPGPPAPGPQTSLLFTSITAGPMNATFSAASSYSIRVGAGRENSAPGGVLSGCSVLAIGCASSDVLAHSNQCQQYSSWELH